MPIEALPNDTFTRGQLMIGLPVITFERALSGGGFGPLFLGGILESAAIAKEIETITLEKGDTGFLTVNREVVSRVAPSITIATHNFSPQMVELIFGSTDGVAVVADAAAAVVQEAVSIPSAATILLAESQMVPLAHGEIDKTAANLTLECAPIVDELVGVGDGILGTADGDFALAYKVAALGDVTRLQEINPTTGAVVRTFVPQATEPAAATEAQLAVGATATSGELDLFQVVASGNELRADYTPSFALEEDENAASPDMLLDPLLGRIRFPNLDGATDALRQGQPMLLSYEYVRRASTTLKPFTRPASDGRATLKLLTTLGSNFSWTIPSCSVILTSDDLSFGADGFATAALQFTVNDAGGTDRFGTMQWSTEAQANA